MNTLVKCCLSSAMILALCSTATAAEGSVSHSAAVAIMQQRKVEQVHGVITDVKGEAIIGANVFVKGEPTNGTVTDLDGNFTLKVPANAVLVVSYIGYIQQEIPVAGKKELTVRLKEDTQSLDEVIVVGYGSVKKSNLTSSVSKMTDESLKDRPVTTVGEAFQGQLAGVQAQASNGGIPGEEMTIRIRGVNTVNGDSSPLYVIDGVPRDNMSDVNPSDIASIQILKDASATAIYGSRGANGVVLIETKTGKGKPVVSFNAYYGLQTPEHKLDLMTPNEYIAYNMFCRNTQHLIAGGKMSDPMSSRNQDYRIPDFWTTQTEFTDWQSAILRTAPIQNYEASASAGSDMGTIFFSVGYTDQNGIIKNTNFNRLNARLNGTLNIRKNFTVGMNLSIASSDKEGAGTNLGDRQGKDSPVHHALMKSPLIAPGVSVWGNGHTGTVSQPLYGSDYMDPLAQLENTLDNSKVNRFQASVYGEWKIIPELVFKSQYSMDYEGETYEYFMPASVTSKNKSEGSSYSTRTNDWVIQNTLTYDKTLGSHHLNLLLGQSAEKQNYYIGNMEATGWPYETISTLNVASTPTKASTERTVYTNASFFGRVSYDYKEKYLMTASLRRDGSSRFGVNTKWGTFPSFSLGWKLSEEQFMKSAGWINLLKIRGSYGTSGNDRIGDYQYVALLGSYNSAYGNALQPGVGVKNIANPDLKWEQTRSIDLGFDFSAFRNRVQLNFDYYVNSTTDLLFNVPIPYATGFNTQLTNLGEIRNQGWELDLTTHNLTGRLKWDTSLNLSHNQNKVIDMGGVQSFTESINDAKFITAVGGPVSQFYVLRTDGLLMPEDFDANGKALVPIAKGQEEGNYKYIDQNGDKKIDDGDLVPYGNNLPDLTWGFTNRFTYKNWDLSILLQGQFGGDVLYLGQRHNDDGLMYNRVLYSRWLNCYKPAKYREALPEDYLAKYGIDMNSWDGRTPYPFGNNMNNNDQRIYDATYARVKNITLTYNFGKSQLQKWGITGLKVYASVDNVYTLSSYPGYTPETSSYGNGTTMLGVDYSTYPLSRKYTLGCSLTF